MNKTEHNLYLNLKKNRQQEYQKITVSEIEKEVSAFFAKEPNYTQEAMEGFRVPVRSEEDVQTMTQNPDSSYHKILRGYMYTTYGHGTVMTGSGGARLMYEVLYKQGMSEEMIESMIHVTLDDGKQYPLSALTVKKTHGTS